MKTKISLASLLFAFSFLSSIVADEPTPIVPGYQRFAEVEDVPDHEKGMLLLSELNCTSCHAGETGWTVKPKQAPILTEVGNRTLPDFFESFVLNPHGVKPGTTMPDVLSGKSEAERKQIAESLGEFLATTGNVVKQSANADIVKKGENLFHSIGCVACHDPLNKDTHITTSIPLGKLDKKYSLPGLVEFILNPAHARPSSRMPQFKLFDKEALAIGSYLLRDVVVNSKIKFNFAYYEGTWEKLPEFDQMTPKSTGIANGFTVKNIGAKNDNFGVVFTGYWQTNKDAVYKFRLGSDDGSKLIIDGKTVVDNDGVHGLIFEEGECELKAGTHEVRVEFFEKGGGEELAVELSGGGYQGVGFETLLRATKEEAMAPDEDAIKLDEVKTERGKVYFQTLGCANCHEMKLGATEIVSTAKRAKPLKELTLEQGCFTGEGNAPSFGLSEHQIQCLKAAINQIKNGTPVTDDPNMLVHQKLMTLNCYACHQRESELGIFGGVVDVTGDSDEVFGRKEWFTGTQAEMGDEGQHPPGLKSVGSKLKPQWLARVLVEGFKDRPYMKTRMPKFGGKEVYGELVEELIAADRLEDTPALTQTESLAVLKKHGRFLAGEEGLSCIKCHTFGPYHATGIQAISLTKMNKRLTKEWFQAYMLKPSKFRRGTRMPESWPGGKTFYPDMLGGDTPKQIDAIWKFLADGPKASKPKGLLIGRNELRATDTPVIYRNFIEGAGPRAIGVGYPEQANLAFDAENCRMALLWQENFIDASRHWTGRGHGFEPPLGENILTLHDSVVFATDFEKSDWPIEWAKEKRPQFKGYRFDKVRRPIFKYVVEDVTIEDQPIPVVVDERPLLNRKFIFESTGSKTISYLIGVGDKIEIEGDVVSVDQKYKTKITKAKSLKKIKLGDKSAVIAIFDLSSGKVEAEQSYDW